MGTKKFTEYYLMNCIDVGQYVKEKCNIFNENSSLDVEEVGDGNINYVYHVVDKIEGKSVIVKQAFKEARISNDMKLDILRGKRESELLEIYDEIVPGLVPKVYNYDEVMCAIIMEDIKDVSVARKGLMKFNIYPQFVKTISAFLARTLFFTSDIYLNHKVKKEYLKKFINIDLCDLTENLVFTEPYNDNNNQNIATEANYDFIKNHIYKNEKLHLEVAELKFNFMTNSQALLHGDLHTGSIFVNEKKMVIFDPEFVFYGPMGYDIGNVIANLSMQLCRVSCFIKHGEHIDSTFFYWLFNAISEVIDSFSDKFNSLYEENITDIMAKTKGFKERYMLNILSDTAGYAGTECIRRIIGIAKAEEIVSISDEMLKVEVEKNVLELGIHMIMNRKDYKSGSDYKRNFLQILNK